MRMPGDETWGVLEIVLFRRDLHHRRGCAGSSLIYYRPQQNGPQHAMEEGLEPFSAVAPNRLPPSLLRPSVTQPHRCWKCWC